MKEDAPAKVDEVVASISGAMNTGPFTERRIRHIIGEFTARLPKEVALSLGKVNVKVERLYGALGSYDKATHTLTLNPYAHNGPTAGAYPLSRETIFHELMHWVHDHGPEEYRRAIKALYARRTAGESLKKVPGFDKPVREDKWYWIYAGTEYGFENGDPAGLEVATTHVQLFARPDQMAIKMTRKNGETIAENLKTILKVFWEKP